MRTAEEALQRLKEGNQRFVQNVRSAEAMLSQIRRADFANNQEPFAIIVGCSDSRVPAEIVFDQGLGDLFVIRVAGNIVAPSQIGSVEFAAEYCGTRLVVVVGHTRCGGIASTVDAILGKGPPSRNLASIVDRIRPAVLPLMQTELRHDRAKLERAAVVANVLAATNQLRHGSAIIESLEQTGGLKVVGAVYDLDTGVVEFLEGL
ncbi:MAG: carbonic anhydrase [Myxococcaceae bacterium]|nr:carbonic anhydrase [Myxococcaceae bacterium]